VSGPAPTVEALLDPSLRYDPSARRLIAGLLAATESGRARFGELADNPGSLSMMLSVRGLNGRLACFDYPAATPRELLGWLIDHPDRLVEVPGDDTPEARRLRGVLLHDDPPGSRARAQERAHEVLATASPFTPAWWRFEAAAAPECVLMTDRLVLTVQSDATEPLAPATPWFPARTRLVRDLEAARRLSGERPYGSLLIADAEPESSIEQLVAAGTPHLDAGARAELLGGYLGRVSWEAARAAVAGSATT
jgi:hypothetical protein